MLKGKKTRIKADRLSGFFKETSAQNILKHMLFVNPDLSLVQCRRILSYAYQLLRGKNAEAVYDKAQKYGVWKTAMIKSKLKGKKDGHQSA